MSTALEAKSLNVRRSDKLVLRNVSFEVREGEVFALLGGNGAGKSSTLLTFLGFLKPASGNVFVQERNVLGNLQIVRQAIAYVPESAQLYGHLTAYENIDYFLSLANKKFHHANTEQAFDTVSLQKDARNQRMEVYSKGMCQKVAIALAILREAPIMLLDEPTAGLDPNAIDEFSRLVRKLSATGTTILMVTHDVYGACQVADKIGVLRQGEFVRKFTRDGGRQIDSKIVHSAFAE